MAPHRKTGARKAGETQSLARALAILDAFDRNRADLGVRQLSRIVHLNKSTVQRLAQTLAHHGFLEQDRTTLRYRVGLRAFEVGCQYVSVTGLEEASFPVLRKLSVEHQLNAYLGVLRQKFAICLIALQSTGPIVVRIDPGSRQHLHSTALGKALLAGLSNARARSILGRGPLPRITPATITNPGKVIREVDEVRRRGYAIACEENGRGVLAVAAPVVDWSGTTVAAISVACPRHLTPDEEIPRVARLVTGSAKEISEGLSANMIMVGWPTKSGDSDGRPSAPRSSQ